MQPRMSNPAIVIPDAMTAIQGLIAASQSGGVPKATLDLVHLRASQINGCAPCIAGGTAKAREDGESDERLLAVGLWRKAPVFSEAERAALALSEAVTELDGGEDAVSDEVWNEAARHYDQTALAALVLWIATTNVFNRLNIATRQAPGGW